MALIAGVEAAGLKVELSDIGPDTGPLLYATNRADGDIPASRSWPTWTPCIRWVRQTTRADQGDRRRQL